MYDMTDISVHGLVAAFSISSCITLCLYNSQLSFLDAELIRSRKKDG